MGRGRDYEVGGFVILPRALAQWEWADNPKAWTLLTHMLLLANYKPGMWQGVKLEAGQFIGGRKMLSRITGLGEQEIRTAIKRLISTGMLTTISTNQYTTYTLCKWQDWQQNDGDNNQLSNQPANQPLTSNQPAANQPLTTSNKLNKENKVKQKSTVDKPPRSPFKPPTVDEVAAYCKQEGKGIDPEAFVDYYTTIGWVTGRHHTPMRSWKTAVNTWERRDKANASAEPERKINYYEGGELFNDNS